MAYRVTYTNNNEFPTDRPAACVLTETLKEAEEKSKELRKCGFKNIIIYDADTGKAVESF